MPTAAPEAHPARASRDRARLALARRAFRDARVRTLGFAYLFAVYAYIQPVGFRHAYPTHLDRLRFAQSFGDNKGIRMFYGEPLNIASVNGYTAWRVGGTLAIAAAIFGVLAGVRALRAEEESGRMEIVLAGAVTRRDARAAALAAIGAGVLVLFVAEFLGYVLGGLPVAGAAFLALATTSVIPVFAAIGALASEIAPTRRLALELSSAAVSLFLVLRVVADTTDHTGWLRWLTPLGWAEELRPFAGSRGVVLVLPLAATIALLGLAALLGRDRDLGSGRIAAHDEARAHLRLLSSPLAQALRAERGTLGVWVAGVGAFAFVLGVVSSSVTAAGVPSGLVREIERLGAGSLFSPAGYLSFVFFFFILVFALFACAQLAAARREEAEGRLETLLALPVGRIGYLGGRVLLAAVGIVTTSLASGLCAWLGAVSVGVDVGVAAVVEAGANGIPVALMFLGIAVVSYALAARAATAISYGVVLVTFLWREVGSLLGAPSWLVDLTPFAYVGLVPTQPFRALAAGVMVGIGLGATLVGLAGFRRRDLVSS